MREKLRCQQQGSVWAILLVLFSLVVGSWQYSEHKAEKKRLAAEQLAAIVKQTRDAEQAELEKRLAQEKQEQQTQKDALNAANRALDAVLSRWDDAIKVASTTGRIALAGPVSTLQGIRRETEALTLVPCLNPAKELLVASMHNTIDGFITFMRNELKIGDTLAKPYFDNASKKLAELASARAGCSK